MMQDVDAGEQMQSEEEPYKIFGANSLGFASQQINAHILY